MRLLMLDRGSDSWPTLGSGGERREERMTRKPGIGGRLRSGISPYLYRTPCLIPISISQRILCTAMMSAYSPAVAPPTSRLTVMASAGAAATPNSTDNRGRHDQQDPAAMNQEVITFQEPRAMSPQASIAHYRIVSKLGEGGMGEVWRATDTKLGRLVAIKILPAAFSDDADRMARFDREAKVLASLNHPNIATVHGVEDRAIILELVEGPTLAERIAQGPIPLDEALPIARQIAEALEYAHEKGINH